LCSRAHTHRGARVSLHDAGSTVADDGPAPRAGWFTPFFRRLLLNSGHDSRAGLRPVTHACRTTGGTSAVRVS